MALPVILGPQTKVFQTGELVIKMSPAINGQKDSYVWIYRMDVFNEHINEIARNMLIYIWEDYLEQIC